MGSISKKNKACFILAIGALTIIGLYLRIVCCNWGNPLQLHPDEPTIVDQTIDMLSRHSWEANVYNRPDHFEIKCNAVLFSVFSRIKYHLSAYEAFHEHKMSFYRLARIYTSIFGTAMIPLAALFVGRLLAEERDTNRRVAQFFSAALTSFSCIFIGHSAYATPDMVLAFFTLLFAYTILRFLNGDEKCIFISAGIVGIGITIKYPAAILCVPLAASAIYQYVEEKKPIKIIRTGLLCIFIVIVTSFVIAPNLFTNYEQTYRTFIIEARPNHLGADGLGFLGNLQFYAKQMIQDQGWLSLLFAFIGAIYMIIHKSKRWISLLTGLVFWVCLSILPLHWERWGTPIYIFYIIVSAIGIGSALSFLNCSRAENRWRKQISICAKSLLSCVLAIWILSLSLSGLCLTVNRTLPDVRNIALSFVCWKKIVPEEALSEGYTPLIPCGSADCTSFFLLSDDHAVKPKIKYATKKYLITSNSYIDRYKSEKTRYPSQCIIYDSIERQYKMIYHVSGEQGNYVNDLSKGLISNLGKAVSYLTRDKEYAGGEITIYDLDPHIVQLKNVQTGKYLCVEDMNQSQSSKLTISDYPYNWVLYENENNTITLISSSSGLAIGASLEGKTPMVLNMQESDGGEKQQWALAENDIANGFLLGNQLALSIEDDSIVLSKYFGEPNQLWYKEINED